jgi:histidinol-phosphate phosphatase family protein
MLEGIIDFSWTLFLDRDGVINKRFLGDYVKKMDDFHIENGVFEFLNFANFSFHKIIVVTNQQGVGKGIMTESDLEEIHRFMIDSINKKGGRIDRVYSATNLKDAQNNIRKPNSFMGHQAKNDYPSIDFNKSIMIGDTNSDILFGKNLGMKTILINSLEKITEESDFQINSLTELIF